MKTATITVVKKGKHVGKAKATLTDESGRKLTETSLYVSEEECRQDLSKHFPSFNVVLKPEVPEFILND